MLRKLSLLVVALMLTASLAHAQDAGRTFVLLHGAFQDASGWADVITALEAGGNTAIAVELPGRGEDETPFSEITLQTYRDVIVDVINAQAEPVVLVGHSFGGISISNVAEAIPEKIASLVYVAAYLPRDGESLVSLAAQDRYSVLGQEGNFIVSADFSTGSINPEIFASAFCPDCTEEQAAAVAASQLDEPLGPQNEPVALTAENFGSVPKTYIMTAQDVVVSPQLQALMIANTPVDRVFALNTGHAPYISQPEALAALLIASE